MVEKIKQCRVKDLGLADYEAAYQLQQSICREVLDGNPPMILLCEHDPVITCGRMTKPENIFMSPDCLQKEHGFLFKKIDRGGDVTLHCPGQIVAYPVISLSDYRRDLHKYLFHLEQVVIDLLKDFDIFSNRSAGKTGVWVGDKKIASLGIGVRKWISFHGIALNVNNDLDLFRFIRPCGMDVKMTSMCDIKKGKFELADVKKKFLYHFAKVFDLYCNWEYKEQ
jgi:lipoate-protein ligase B